MMAFLELRPCGKQPQSANVQTRRSRKQRVSGRTPGRRHSPGSKCDSGQWFCLNQPSLSSMALAIRPTTPRFALGKKEAGKPAQQAARSDDPERWLGLKDVGVKVGKWQQCACLKETTEASGGCGWDWKSSQEGHLARMPLFPTSDLRLASASDLQTQGQLSRPRGGGLASGPSSLVHTGDSGSPEPWTLLPDLQQNRSGGCQCSGPSLFWLHRKRELPRLVQWVQSVLGAVAEPSLREGDWDPGTCLFPLYPFNMVVTKANTLQVQSLENVEKAKEETKGNLSPRVSLFYSSFQSFFCVCTCVRMCSLPAWAHRIHSARGICFFFVSHSRVSLFPCQNTCFFAIIFAHNLFLASCLSKV